jgi:hypothetical protein
MDLTKLFLILCVVLLCVSMIFCFSTYLFVHQTWVLVNDEKGQSESAPDQSISQPNDTPTDILVQTFCVRETEGRIAIYTGDGYLVRYLDVEVSLLPSEDQEALKHGITLSSWKELLALIEDYTQ